MSTEFDQLGENYYANLYRFALGLCRREDQSCDLVQQTFLKWAQKGHTLRNRKKVKSWLFTTLYREFLQTIKRRRQEESVDPDDLEQAAPALSPAAVRKLDGDLAMAALQSMPERYRSVLTLFYLREHSYAEIAEVLGIPPGTVMSRLYRGKRMLMDALAVEEEPPAPPLRIMEG